MSLRILYKYSILLLIVFLVSCVNDDFYETMKRENNYTEILSVYFKIPDSNQTTSYTGTYGEDHDYLNTPYAMSYNDNGDGTVTDNLTGLMWLKCTMTSTGADTSPDCSGTHQKVQWYEAIDKCDGLEYAGYDDWRLPTIPELSSIIHYGKPGPLTPAIDESAFPGTEYEDCYDDGAFPTAGWKIFCSGLSEEKYWTGTRWGPNEYAWSIHFDDGYTNFSDFEQFHYVRCVRNDD